MIVRETTLENARHMLARAVLRGDTTAGAASLDEVCAGGRVFEGLHDGRTALVFVLAMRDHAAARVCWVQAAAGHAPGVDLTGAAMPMIEQHARSQGAGQVAVTTRRPGLVRKLKAAGYRVTGVTLRKAIA